MSPLSPLPPRSPLSSLERIFIRNIVDFWYSLTTRCKKEVGQTFSPTANLNKNHDSTPTPRNAWFLQITFSFTYTSLMAKNDIREENVYHSTIVSFESATNGQWSTRWRIKSLRGIFLEIFPHQQIHCQGR